MAADSRDPGSPDDDFAQSAPGGGGGGDDDGGGRRDRALDPACAYDSARIILSGALGSGCSTPATAATRLLLELNPGRLHAAAPPGPGPAAKPSTEDHSGCSAQRSLEQGMLRRRRRRRGRGPAAKPRTEDHSGRPAAAAPQSK
jgi:hypothetical protein